MPYNHRATGMSFFSLETAWRTFQGYEVMNMRRSRHVKNVSKVDMLSQKLRYIEEDS
jgi:O-acetylhomoserine/O-acetylserine sulfhydrylase-like pyridoxal-dependent enzyme